MPALYEINSKLRELLEKGFTEECIDLETGEFDEAKAELMLAELQEQKNSKIEGTALYIEELESDIRALSEKKKALEERMKRLGKKSEWLSNYLARELNAERFESPMVCISFRKSYTVNAEIDKLPAEYVRVKTMMEPDKMALKKALLGGSTISGATLVENKNIQIK